MNWTNLAKWVLAVPAITAWVDFFAKQQIWEAAWWTIKAVEDVLNTWSWVINPIFKPAAWVLSAWLLSNSVLKEFDWMKDHTKTRWALNLAAAWLAYTAWAAASPYLVAGWLSYAIWKHGWKYGKEALNRWFWAIWWMTGWAVAWWVRLAWKWLKGEQFSWDWIWKLNPKF